MKQDIAFSNLRSQLLLGALGATWRLGGNRLGGSFVTFLFS